MAFPPGGGLTDSGCRCSLICPVPNRGGACRRARAIGPVSDWLVARPGRGLLSRRCVDVNNDSTWLWIVGLIAAGVIVLLLTAPGAQVAPSVPAAEVLTTAPSVGTVSTAPALPPSVDAGANLSLDEREAVRLNATGRDAAGRPLTYRWVAEGGRGSFDNAYLERPMYTAPSICCCEECVTLVLTVTNDRGASATDRLTVRVRDAFQASSCDAATPCSCGACASRCEGTCARLAPAAKLCGHPSPCGCEAPCGAPVVVAPCCPAPARPCDSPCVRQVSAPEPARPIAVPCPCDDPCGFVLKQPSPCGGSPCGERRDSPTPFPLKPPCASGPAATPLIGRQYPSSVNEGGSIALDATVGGPGCGSVCYHWTADKGWFEDSGSLNPVWHAPADACPGGESVCIKLTTTEPCGKSGYDQIRVRINDSSPYGGGHK